MQITAITVKDSVPADHVFQPITSMPATYRRVDVVGQPTIGQERVMVQLYPAAKGSTVDRVVVRLYIPVLEATATGSGTGYVAAPKVAYELQSKHEFFLPVRSTVAGRKDLRVIAKNLLDNAQVIDIIENLAPPY